MVDPTTKKSYFAKKVSECPICEHRYHKEEMFTGSGRINAGDLTDELHRLYIASERFGTMHPLIYSLDTCPNCLFSAFPFDIGKMKNPLKKNLKNPLAIQRRKELVNEIVSGYNFSQLRSLKEGIASNMAALVSYESFPESFAPHLKQGIAILRAAWLSAHLHQEELPDENYNYLAKVLYRKAAYYYNRALELHEEGREVFGADSVGHYGPDSDHNFGMDGVIYLASLLQYKYGQRTNIPLRKKKLERARISLARLFGSGKSSANKPSAILYPSRELFDNIKKELKRLEKLQPSV